MGRHDAGRRGRPSRERRVHGGGQARAAGCTAARAGRESLMPLNRPNPAAGRPTGPFPAVPPYIDANGIPTNDPGSADAPVTAPVTAGPGADASTTPAAAPAAPSTANYDKI